MTSGFGEAMLVGDLGSALPVTVITGITAYLFYLFAKTGRYFYLFAGITLSIMVLVEIYFRIFKKKPFWTRRD